MRDASVVTSFLLRTSLDGHDEVLILRRSRRVGTYRGRWAGVSGYLEVAPSRAEEQARRELREETGLTQADIELVRTGQSLTFEDDDVGTRWTVHPFLFRLRSDAAIAIDWEHTETRWVRPSNLSRYHTVPRLKEALARVYPPSHGDVA